MTFYIFCFRKHTLNCHRMKPGLFSVLCEIKEKTGKTTSLMFVQPKMYNYSCGFVWKNDTCAEGSQMGLVFHLLRSHCPSLPDTHPSVRTQCFWESEEWLKIAWYLSRNQTRDVLRSDSKQVECLHLVPST